MMHYGQNLTGNERFFGFCVDILARVASEVGFEYILDLAPDKKYGAKDPTTGEWNGMVFQLMKHVSFGQCNQFCNINLLMDIRKVSLRLNSERECINFICFYYIFEMNCDRAHFHNK